MLRYLVLSLFMFGPLMAADEPTAGKLVAPETWSGETIELPPGFAPDMKLKGKEHIRFAPGMMTSTSETFFTYAFVFEVETKPDLTEAVIQDEFLKYYRGLCIAVLNGKRPEVDPSKFTLELKPVKRDENARREHHSPMLSATYTGKLDWVEPFATKKPQTLNLEIQTWTREDRSDIFVCVSPQSPKSAVWKELHTIRDAYWKSQVK